MSKETETVECVTIEARMPKAFIDHIQKQKWFIKGYEDLDDFISDAVRRLKMHYERGGNRMSETETDSKKDLDLQMIPVKVELCKPFYDFLQEYRQYFGSQYTVELICTQTIYSQVKRLFNELDGFAREKDSFLDKSDFFKKYSYLGLVSFDDSEEETE